MKAYLITLSIGIVVSFGFGFIIGASSIQNGNSSTIESKRIINEVIKYVDTTDQNQVNAALNSKIIITRSYSDLTNGFIIADFSASDGYKRTIGQDSIRVDVQRYTTRNIVQIGYGVYMANRIIYGAPELTYLRKYGMFGIGGGVIVNTWSANQIIGFKLIGSWEF